MRIWPERSLPAETALATDFGNGSNSEIGRLFPGARCGKNGAATGSDFDLLDAITVHGGRTLLGYVLDYDDHWTAFGREEQRIGCFACCMLATRAVRDVALPLSREAAMYDQMNSRADRCTPANRSLERTTFRTSRLLEFCSKRELVAQTGLIYMPADLAARVRDYRFDHRVDTQAEAIRLLIEKGLEVEAKAKARRPS